jgi:hypothetical protein
MEAAFDLVPEAICIVNKDTLAIMHANSMFSSTIAPLSKFKGLNFLEDFVAKEEHSRFQLALNQVKVHFTMFREHAVSFHHIIFS